MELSCLQTCCIPVSVGLCWCVGFVLNIPLIMAILGLILNVWINKGISPDIVLGGMFSGLSSTGVHQLFKQLIQVQSDEK